MTPPRVFPSREQIAGGIMCEIRDRMVTSFCPRLEEEDADKCRRGLDSHQWSHVEALP